MRNPVLKFSHKDIGTVLFDDTAPQVTVYPFWKSSVEQLALMDFSVSLSSKVLDSTTIKAHTKLARSIVAVRKTKVSPRELQEYFDIATTPLVNLIFLHVAVKYLLWRDYFVANLSDFVKKPESKFQWEIAQSIGIGAIMTAPYSLEQKMWIAYASATSRNDEKKFVMDVTESLKPWINNELFQHIEKLKESRKENTALEAQRKQMLEGSFGMTEEDTVTLSRMEQQITDRRIKEAEMDIVR